MVQIEVICGQLRTRSLTGVILFAYYLCMLSAYVCCIIRRWNIQTVFVLLVNYHLSYHCNTWREYEIPYISCTSFCCRLYQKSIKTWLWNWLMKNKKRRRRRKIKVVPIYWKMIGSRLCLRTQILKWTKMQKNTGQYLNLSILMLMYALFAICTICSFIYEVETRPQWRSVSMNLCS